MFDVAKGRFYFVKCKRVKTENNACSRDPCFRKFN